MEFKLVFVDNTYINIVKNLECYFLREILFKPINLINRKTSVQGLLRGQASKYFGLEL